jgi:flagellin
VQSANATNSAGDRQALQAEVNDLVSEMDRIASSTNFNGRNILDGTFGAARFQVGANANETVTATTANLRTERYGAYLSGTNTKATNATQDTYRNAAADAFDVAGSEGTATITYANNDSAYTVGQLINQQTGNTGVEADAKTEFALDFTATGSYTVSFATGAGDADAVNKSGTSGVATVSFNVSAVSSSDGLSEAVTAINDQTAKTGLVAEVSSDGAYIQVRHDLGYNVEVALSSGPAALKVGEADNSNQIDATTLAAATGNVTGEIELLSDSNFATSGDAGSLFFTDGAATLNSVQGLDVTTYANSNTAINIVDMAIAKVNGERAKFGAMQNRFESVISNLSTTSENLAAARSRIKDTDFAAETASLTRSQILQQAGVAMLAQANAMPQSVLSLLG